MSWADFIRSHMAVLARIDFFTVEVLTWRGLATYYVLFFLCAVLSALGDAPRHLGWNHSTSYRGMDGANGSSGRR